MADMKEIDIEKSASLDNKSPPHEVSEYGTYTEVRSASVAEEIAHARHLQMNFGPFRVLRKGEEWLDTKLGIETQGIDRIPEEEKTPPSIWNSFFMWWSMTCHVGTLPIGILGPEFGLTLGQSVAAIVVGTFLGAICTAYCGTLGPKVPPCPHPLV